jgi:hypothetical protein
VSALASLNLGTDRVRYLSDLTPRSVTETPFLCGEWPYRVDRSVGGRELTVAGTRFRKGLGVHARSRITFEVPEGFRRFLAQVGIDDETGGKGAAVFRVLLDGKVRVTVSPVRGGEEAKSVEVPLEGAKTITLEVDFGEAMDVGDHADWCDAKIVKD